MLLPLAGHLMLVIQRLLSQGLCCHLAGFIYPVTEHSAESYRQSTGLVRISSTVSELLCSGQPLSLSELHFPHLQSRIMTSTSQKRCENERGKALRVAPDTEYDLEGEAVSTYWEGWCLPLENIHIP